MMITAKHPVRNAVAGIPTYYDSIGSAMDHVCKACNEHSIDVLFPADGSDFTASEGRVTFPLSPADGAWIICNHCAEKSEKNVFGNVVVFSWYTMESGRVELTAYVS